MNMIFSLILPNHIDKTRPVLISHRGLVSFVFLILSIIFSFGILTFKFDKILGYATNISANDLLRYTNDLRSDKGLSALIFNDQLSRAAEAKAKDMFKNNYWAHASPQGAEPWDFILSSGYDYFYAGENLAVDFSDSKSVVKAWNDSVSHRENILNKNYTDVGFAVVDGELQGRKTTLVVQMFGSPRKTRGLTAVSSDKVEPKETTETAQGAAEAVELEELEVNIPPVETLFDKNVPDTLEKITEGQVLDSQDVFNVSKYMAILLGLFLTVLFSIDGYYVRRYGILRISGHTFFHVAILLMVIVGIWYTNIGLIL